MDEAQGTPAGEIELTPDKQRTAAYLFGCVAFVFLGMIDVSRHHGGMIAWVCVLFFGIGAAVFAIRLIPGASYLRLSGPGFQIRNLYRDNPLILWRDISEFRVVRLPPTNRPVVVFNWYAAPNRGMRQLNTRLTDATDSLPDTYGLQPEELAAYMNAWRSRATSNG